MKSPLLATLASRSCLLLLTFFLASCEQDYPASPAEQVINNANPPVIYKASSNYTISSSLGNGCEIRVSIPEIPDDTNSNAIWQYGCKKQWRLLGENLSAMLQTTMLSPSPDKRFLAVESVGEGHPLIEVIDLPALLEKQRWTVLYELNPFPGTASIVSWNEKGLLVQSDMNLEKLPLALTDNDIADSASDFLLTADKWLLEKQ